MNMIKSVALTSAILATAAVAAEEGGSGIFDGGWRLTAGAVYNSPVRTNVRFSPRSLRPASRATSGTGVTSDEAKAKALGVTDPVTGRKVFPSGAWYNPNAADLNGEGTWEMYIPNGRRALRGSGADAAFSLGEASYGETIAEYAPANIPCGYASDESAMPGINVELSRELYRHDEYGFGLDLAFGVSYFFRNDAFKGDYGYLAGRDRSSTEGGSFEGRIDAVERSLSPEHWDWNDDGSYGHGGMPDMDGLGGIGGPVFDIGSIAAVNHPGVSSFGSSDRMGAMYMRGDYRQLEFLLSARPYYDVTDWLRVIGTIGLAVSRDEMDFDFLMSDNGYHYRKAHDVSQWNVYGIAGLGAMLRYEDFTLGFDFLARFLDDDITVDERYVHGTIERGRWMFRLMLGYEF